MTKHFFLLGASKTGSTSFYYYASQHPHINVSDPKEPNFFLLDARYGRGIEFYEQCYFEDGTDKIRGDFDTNNLYYPWIANRISKHYPDAKFIVFLRNPVDRTVSEYCHRVNLGLEYLGFKQAIKRDYHRIQQELRYLTEHERSAFQKHLLSVRNKKIRMGVQSGVYREYIDRSYYYEQILRYLKFTNRSQIKIVVFDNFVSNPRQVCNQLFEFLDTEPLEKIDVKAKARGRMKISPRSNLLIQSAHRSLRKSPLKGLRPLVRWLEKLNTRPKEKFKPDPRTIRFLHDHFKEETRKLSEIVNGSLAPWLSSNRGDGNSSEEHGRN